MTAIGIRVTPSEVYYSILTEGFSIVTVSKVIIPKALEDPDKLTFIRTTFISIIDEYNIKNAGIKLIEYGVRNPSFFRINVEGIIQELFANSSIQKYFYGAIPKIASLIKEDKSNLKRYFKGELEFTLKISF